ncbi:hypothetical protein [Halobacterium zhouii]|uniref:hypothetical protein n=1 Tax=Halobacterium zhouii TaxID=2902624 RepID=UPI001E384560|nr:hypothetical protein [Halobacterium zhouii]
MATGRDGGDDDQRLAMKVGDATASRPPRGRASRLLTRVKRWILLTASRWLVTALLLVVTFAVIVAIGAYGPIPVRSFLTAGASPGAILVELMKAIVSIVVIVLSINQLVLSPGLGPVSDQQTRYDDSMELRRRMEALTGTDVSPSSPAAFLRVVVDEIARQADEVHDAAAGLDDATDRESVQTYAETVASEARAVSRQLSTDRFGMFEVTPTVLRFAISEKVRDLRGLQEDLDRAGGEDGIEALDRLYDLLELFTVSREYLKTVYIRSEYVNFSEALLYIGLPSLVATYVAAQMYSPDVFPGTTFGIETQLLFVALAVTVSISPFALLTAYVFRLAAMSRSTLFVGPFAAGRDRE